MSILLLRARLLGADDISFGRNSIVYVNYLGVTHTIAQVNASHIPIMAQGYYLEDLFNGSFGPNIYPNLLTSGGTITAGGNLVSSGTLAVTGNTTLSGTLTLSAMNVAGYVKNSAAGLLSGGNALTITTADVPRDVITGSAAYAESNTGTDTYTITLVPALTSYASGQLIAFKPDTDNTGACSLNVNGIGAVAIKRRTKGSLYDPVDGDIRASRISYVVYDAGGGPAWELLNPAPSRNTVTFTADDTWTRPKEVLFVNILCVGGGGAGGGTAHPGNSTGGGGGGGGAVAFRFNVDVSASATVTVDVGAGGAGASGSNGGDGGDTTFGAFLTGEGGKGGVAGWPGPGTGGAAGNHSLYTVTTNDIAFNGTAGSNGVDEGASTGYGGAGGDSGNNRGQGGATTTLPGDGADGGLYGGGGAGSMHKGGVGAYAGGDGKAGLCVIWW